MNRSLFWISHGLAVVVLIGVVTIAISPSEKPVVHAANTTLRDSGPLPELSGAVAARQLWMWTHIDLRRQLLLSPGEKVINIKHVIKRDYR